MDGSQFRNGMMVAALAILAVAAVAMVLRPATDLAPPVEPAVAVAPVEPEPPAPQPEPRTSLPGAAVTLT